MPAIGGLKAVLIGGYTRRYKAGDSLLESGLHEYPAESFSSTMWLFEARGPGCKPARSEGSTM